MNNAITPTMARTILVSLAGRCTETNTTPAFRSAIQQAIEALDRGELVSANTIISQTCANVSGKLHECNGHEWPDHDPFPPCYLQADEEETRAYTTLDGLRFGFGYLTLGKMGNNVLVLRS